MRHLPWNDAGRVGGTTRPARGIDAGSGDVRKGSTAHQAVPVLDVRLLERTDRRTRTVILRAWLAAVAVLRLSTGEFPTAADALRMLAAKGAS